jgi:hypothetical protein
MTEPLIFEYSVPGRRGVELPEPDVPEAPLPEGFQRRISRCPRSARWMSSATSSGSPR